MPNSGIHESTENNISALRDKITIECNNRYDKLKEIEVADREIEVCLAASVIKNLASDSEYWRMYKRKNLTVIRRSRKPVIIVRNDKSANDETWNALIDTGSERCLLNYKQFKCLGNEHLHDSKVRIKGVTGETTNVVGEVELNLKLSNGKTVTTDALILKDVNFAYDLILGRDVLQEAEIDLKHGTLKLQGETIDFMDKEKTTHREFVADTDCLVAQLVMQQNRNKRKPWNNSFRKIAETMNVSQLNNDDDAKIKADEPSLRKNNAAEEEIPTRDIHRDDPKIKHKRRSGYRPNVHVNSEIIEANTMKCINAFARSNAGEYILPKKMLKSGLLVAEGLYKMEEKTGAGINSVVTVIINPTDNDIYLRENEMIGMMHPHQMEDTTEVYLTTVSQCLQKDRDVDDAVDVYVMGVETERTSGVNKQNTVSAHPGTILKASSLAGGMSTSEQLPSLSISDVECHVEAYRIPLCDTLNRYRDVITLKNEPIGTTNVLKHQIVLKNDATVQNIPPYRIPHKYKSELEAITKQMLQEDIIEPSMSDWNFPVIVVKKKSGEIRPCIDMRALNKQVCVQSYPLPRVDEMLSALGGCSIFTSLDLRSAYHQVELTDDSKDCTAFTVNFQKYNFTKLPFGYKNAPSVFQSIMCRVLQELLGKLCFVFLDDILIFSKNINDHLKDVEKVLSNLRAANLKLKLEKCVFFKDNIKFLGHSISKEGIQCVNNEKVLKMPQPTNVKELQRFLGLANYFRKFIPVFSRIAEPLYRLLNKDNKFEWTEKCNISFHSLKQSLVSPTVLAHPNYHKPFFVFTDASDSGIGACLMQADNSSSRNLRPIAFYSKSLNSTQKRYSVTKKEFFAIHSSLKEFQYIILGYPITILSDHKPLTAFFGRKIPLDTAMARWCIEINSYDVQIKYFEGKRNIVADTLSRLTENPIPESSIDKLIDMRKDIIDKVEICAVQTRTQTKLIQSKSDSKESDPDIDSNSKSDTPKPPFIDYIPKVGDITWSVDELKFEQSNDPFCSEIVDLLSNKIVSDFKDLPDYMLIENVLYKYRKIDHRDIKLFNVVIPSALLTKAINSVHYRHHGDHFHTLFQFKLLYYHPQERSMIRRFASNCEICKILKSKLDKPIKLLSAPIARVPFETVAIDFVGPLITTDKGNKYILTIVDLFSRFTILHAVPNKSSNIVLDCLTQTFNQFGYPKTLISDNALEFVSKAMKIFVEINQIYKVEVLPYCPWSNGICERQNANISKLLKFYIHCVAHNNWDEYISVVGNAINNNLNITLGDTPSYVFLGRDTCPSTTITLEPLYTSNLETDVKHHARTTALIHEQIRHTIMTQTQLRTSRHNLSRLSDKNLTVGDRVLIKNHRKSHKLELTWLGPGRITSITNNKCIIQLGNSTIKSNLNYIKKLGTPISY